MPARSAEDVENCRFQVNPSRNIPLSSFKCTAASRELAAEWVSKINSLLKTQTDLIKALQSPIAYQKELTRDS